MSSNEQQPDFESVKTRLAEIAEAVDDESLSLDDALDLYEEAVSLGLQASDLLETGVVVPEEEADEADEQPTAAGEATSADDVDGTSNANGAESSADQGSESTAE